MSADYKKLGENTLVLTIGNFSSKILNYLMIPLYTYVLTTEEYGIVDIIITTVTLLIPVLSLSMNEAVMQFALDAEYNKKKINTIGSLIGVFSCLAFLLLMPIFCLSDIIKEDFILFFFVYISQLFSGIIGQFAKGCGDVKTYTLAGVVQTVVFLLCNIVLLVLFSMGIRGYLLSNIISNVANACIIFFGLRIYRYYIVLKREDLNLLRKMLEYSIPLIPNNISWWISNSSDKYVLSFFFGASMVGLYSTAYKIPSIMQVFITIFWSAWQISAVENFGSEESRLFFGKIYNALTSMLSLLCALVICLSEVIARIAFQKDFFLAWRFSPILVLGFLFSGLSSFLGTIYTSAKKTRMILYSTLVGALINIILNLYFIPMWNGYGAAIATLVSYFITWLFRVIDSKRILKIDIDYKKNLRDYFFLMALVICNLAVKTHRYIYLALLVALIFANEYVFVVSAIRFVKKLADKFVANIKIIWSDCVKFAKNVERNSWKG